jgi:hypothetical protein
MVVCGREQEVARFVRFLSLPLSLLILLHRRTPQSDAMQHLLENMDALWPSLDTDGRRALRLCCMPLRDAVDAHAGGLDCASNAPVLSGATCGRLSGVSTATLRSMESLRGMAPLLPRLKSLRLLLEVRAP